MKSHGHEGHCCCHDHGNQAIPPKETLLNPGATGEVQTTLKVAGMDCADEIKAIEDVLAPLPGVRELRVNLMAGKVTIFHGQSVTPEALIAAISTAGLKAAPENQEIADNKLSRRASVALSGLFTGAGLLLEWFYNGPEAPRDVAFALGIAAGWWFILPKAWQSLKRRSLDMNVLMTAAVLGALAIHQWSEAAVVCFLFSLSELLEALSLARARKAVQALIKLTPETALLQQGADFREVPVEQVPVGSVIAIRPGARIPLDGVVAAGTSAVDQAPITGESMPVDKAPQDPVYAGTINGAGALEIRTSKPYTETAIAKIIHLVEEAQAQKAPTQRFVDTFARIYTPAVMAAALAVILAPPLLFGGAWGEWFYRGLVLLVIACPCALVISTPVSIVSGLTAMARRGVLIKGGAVLEAVGRLNALAVDKTGTITEGKPRVTRVISLNSKSEAEILRIAAGLDVHSDHPLAQAVVRYAEEKAHTFPRAENYQTRAGRGAEGIIEGHYYFVGNHRFTHEMAVCSDEIERQLAEIENDMQSVVVVGHKPHDDCKGEVLGILAVGDAVRANAPEAIAALHRMGIKKIIMLSGDNQRTASAIAKKTGIDEAYGDLLPEQKIEKVRELLSSYQVGMIGDGVNDAPAMAAATVGIAMGAGTDTALETADMALIQNDLGKIADAIRLGERTLSIIRFNIVFALGLKALFIALALSGHASLWAAITADTGATLLVIANALRLLRHEGK
ncbi:MAG: heavy metal translocating P-type ATPase [Chthoniobacteraceae bacterium]